MKPFFKNPLSVAGFFISFLTLAGGYALTIYLFFLQINTAFSQKRFLAAIVAGIALTSLYFYLSKKNKLIERINRSYVVKTILVAVVVCGFFWMMFPTPKNYLLAPQGQFDITIHRESVNATGVTQLMYFNNGLDYISPDQLQFEPDNPVLNKGESTTLVFNEKNESGFSWQGRAWKSMVITFSTSQPIEVILNSGVGNTRYQFNAGNDLVINVPVATSGYYFCIWLTAFIATLVTATSVIGMIGLIKWRPSMEPSDVEIPRTPGMKFLDALFLTLFGLTSATIVIFGFLNKLYSDDYCYILNLKRLGWFKAIPYYLRVNNGRYSSHIFDLLAFEVPSVNTVIGPITAFLLIGSSLFYLFLQLLKQYEAKTRYRLSTLFSITLVGAIFLVVPNLYESFIWNLHSIIVSGGFACFIMSSAIFIKNYNQKQSTAKIILWSCFYFIWGLLGAGFAEVTIVLNMMVSGIVLLVILFRNRLTTHKKNLVYLLVYLVSNGLGMIMMTKVPGSAKNMNLLFSAKISDVSGYLYEMTQTNTALVLNSNDYLPVFILLVVILGGYFWGKTLPKPLGWVKQPISFLGKLSLACLPIITIFVAFFPLAFFKGYLPPRTLAIPISYALTEAFILAIALGNSRRNATSTNKSWIAALTIAVLITCVPLIKYLVSYSHQLINHNQEWEMREEQILQGVSGGRAEIVVHPLQYPLGTDLSTWENLWLVDCVSNYYGIDLIVEDK